MNELDEAKAALANVKTAEARLAQDLSWPFWRHAAVGGLISALMLGQALDSTFSIMISAGVLLGALALRSHDKMRDGMFVSGLRRGGTAWISSLLIVLAVAAVVVVRIGIPAPQTAQPVFWVLVVAIATATTALSYLWQRIYRDELRGTEQ